MSPSSSRRRFLVTSTALSAGLGWDLSSLTKLRPVHADEVKITPDIVRFRSEIEPVVRLLEETDRDQVLEVFAQRIHEGLSYQEVLAALLLAGVRNVEPRPSVGFKFHAVLVVNSAHLASIASPASERWLPIFWALDQFKSSQERDVREGNWTMPPVEETKVPGPHLAKKAFIHAMENWDVEAADVAVAGLARSAGSQELFELFSHYGCRDFRSIGHKAIYVSNSWRTLQFIGWQHAEPVLRSLAYALLNHHGESNPATSDHAADRPWRDNQPLVESIRDEWQSGKADQKAASDFATSLRTKTPSDCCQHLVKLLNAGVAPQSIWDGLFTTAGECLYRQPGIVALHAVTTTNAMHYAFQTTPNNRDRKLLMLQNAAFLPMFIHAMKGRGSVRDNALGDLEPLPTETRGVEAVNEVFSDISQDRNRAAKKMLWLLKDGTRPENILREARRLVFLKGNDSHDYKFSSAVLEDYYHISPQARDHYLASSVFSLNGAGEPNSRLVDRTLAALS